VPVDAAASRHVADKPAVVPAIDEPLRGLGVLCIDNEPKILDGMRLLLSGWGCTVTLAESVAAVEALVAAGAPAIDAVIADYHLDDGTGIAAIGRLRATLGREIPALLVTADRTPDVRAEAERDNILVQNKPVRPASMRAWLTQLSTTAREAAE
jgi:CheY-like chemotaxis protein